MFTKIRLCICDKRCSLYLLITFSGKKYHSFSRYNWRLNMSLNILMYPLSLTCIYKKKSIKCLCYPVKYVLPCTFAAWGFGVCTLWGLIVGIGFFSLLSSSSLLFSFMVLFESVETPMDFLSRYNLTQLAKVAYGSESKLNKRWLF